MGILDTAVSQLRIYSTTMRDKTATVLTPSYTSDGAGGNTVSWAAGVSVSCRVSPVFAQNSEDIIASRIATDQRYEVYMSHSMSLTEEQRLIIEGQQYEILCVYPPHSYVVETRVLCVKSSNVVAYD